MSPIMNRGVARPWAFTLVAALVASISLMTACVGGAAEQVDSSNSNDGIGESANAFSRDETVTLPAGTTLTLSLMEPLSTSANREGDPITARLAEPVTVDGQVVLEDGAMVYGEIDELVPARKIGGRAKLGLRFTQVRSGEAEADIAASFRKESQSQTRKDAATIGGATAGGALLGRIIGHKEGKEADGTAVGAVVGAAVGTVAAARNKPPEVALPAGTTIVVSLSTPVDVPVRG